MIGARFGDFIAICAPNFSRIRPFFIGDALVPSKEHPASRRAEAVSGTFRASDFTALNCILIAAFSTGFGGVYRAAATNMRKSTKKEKTHF